MVFPLGSPCRGHAAGWSMPTSTSACIASSAACCARRWSAPICRRRSACTPPRNSCASSANCRGRSRAVHRAREAHHDQADLGSVALCHAGFLRHRQLRDRRNETYARGVRHFLEDEMGVPCTFAFSREARASSPTTRPSRAAREARRHWCCSGSYNERMYAAEAGSRAVYIPASFPGAIIRRAYRHAVHGLCRRDLYRPGSLQRAVRRAVQHPAARDRDGQGRRRRPAGSRSSAVGRRRPSSASTTHLETEPFLVRISAAKRLRDRVEQDARHAGEDRVTAERVMRSLAALTEGQPA